MVVCDKCGTDNKEGSQFCINCGAPMYTDSRPAHIRSDQRKKVRDECFGLPHGGTIGGLILGLIIILWGARELFNWRIDFGPFIIIIIGLLIIGGALYKFSQRSG